MTAFTGIDATATYNTNPDTADLTFQVHGLAGNGDLLRAVDGFKSHDNTGPEIELIFGNRHRVENCIIRPGPDLNAHAVTATFSYRPIVIGNNMEPVAGSLASVGINFGTCTAPYSERNKIKKFLNEAITVSGCSDFQSIKDEAINCGETATRVIHLQLGVNPIISRLVMHNDALHPVTDGVRCESTCSGAEISYSSGIGCGSSDANTFNRGSVQSNHVTRCIAASGAQWGLASITFDPVSLARNIPTALQTLALPGALLGDDVRATFSINRNGVFLEGHVASSGSARFYFTNLAGPDPTDLASGTVTLEIV